MSDKKPKDVDDGGGTVVVDGRNYFPVDPPVRRRDKPAWEDELDDDVDQPAEPQFAVTDDDVKKVSDSAKDGKPTRASAQQARMIPAKPVLTIAAGSLGTFLPIVAQATSARDLLIVGGSATAAAGAGVVRKAVKGRRARKGTTGGGRGNRSGKPGRGQRGNGVLSGARMPDLGSGRRAAGNPAGKGGPLGRLAGLTKGRNGAGPLSKHGKAASSAATPGGARRRAGAGAPAGGGRLRNALNRARTAATNSRAATTGRRTAAATRRGVNGTARTRTGRAFGALGRGAMSPFRAIGQGVTGARKSNGWGDAVRRARKQTKKHRRNNDRSWHPFAGWGAALAGVGAYGATRLGRLLRAVWKWNPAGADGEAAARVIADKVREDPDAPQQPTTSTSDAGRPIVVAPPPVQRIGTRTAHHSRPGGTTMTDSSLVMHAMAMKNEAERRANVGARQGILEVVDDSKRFGLAIDQVTGALAAEVQAVKRFPFHPAVQAAYDAALEAMANAGKVMTQCAVSIEDIHRKELEDLRNPSHQNAQMWDHTSNNGARGGA